MNIEPRWKDFFTHLKNHLFSLDSYLLTFDYCLALCSLYIVPLYILLPWSVVVFEV